MGAPTHGSLERRPEERGRVSKKRPLPRFISPSRSDRTESASGSEDGGDNVRDVMERSGNGAGVPTSLEHQPHLLTRTSLQSLFDEREGQDGENGFTDYSSTTDGDEDYDGDEVEVDGGQPQQTSLPRTSSSSSNIPESSSSIMTEWELAKNIEVDALSGAVRFTQPSVECDACPYCFDVCGLASCNDCDMKRQMVQDIYNGGGELSSSSSSMTSEPVTHGPDVLQNGQPQQQQQCSSSSQCPEKHVFTLCEVRRHRRTGSAWIVSAGSVYDVTGYLDTHPGGKVSILRKAGGEDCVEDFHFHTKSSQKLWKTMLIGTLVECPGKKLGGTCSNDGKYGYGIAAAASATATAAAAGGGGEGIKVRTKGAITEEDMKTRRRALEAMVLAMRPPNARCSGGIGGGAGDDGLTTSIAPALASQCVIS